MPPDVKLPGRTRVYVILPATLTQKKARLLNPRLKNPEQVRDFVMGVGEERSDAYV